MTKSKIEDPARIGTFLESINRLAWTPEVTPESLRVVFESVTTLAQAEVRYYFSRRQRSKWFSISTRFLSWLLGGIGIMVPLIYPVLGDDAPETFLSWGYLAFGMAGIVLIADRLFAGSQAHQRYVRAQLGLEKLITVFGVEWQVLLASYDAEKKPEQVTALLSKAAEFAGAFHESLGGETLEWEKNVNEALAHLKAKVAKG